MKFEDGLAHMVANGKGGDPPQLHDLPSTANLRPRAPKKAPIRASDLSTNREIPRSIVRSIDGSGDRTSGANLAACHQNF